MKHLTLFLLILGISQSMFAQENDLKNIDEKELNLIIQKIADSLETYYVDLGVGVKIGKYLKNKNRNGEYKNIRNPRAFAKQLTTDLRSINGDKHLSVSFRPINDDVKSKKAIEGTDKSGIWSNYGFQEVQILDGNIGYVRVSNFSNWDHLMEAKKAASAAMNMVSNTDAIIFDVRNNGGGVPYLVSYLASYLFDGERVHLTEFIHRFNNGGYGVYTETNIPGKRLPNVPVYILVNKKTASAGEEFAFWLKHLKRAIIIGETTMGAGYGALSHRLNNRFIVSISSEEEVNPITKTGFEQVGVIPNIKSTSDSAYSKAKELATIASKEYRLNKTNYHAKLLDELTTSLRDSLLLESELLIVLSKCKTENILDESKINSLGYEYVTKYSKPVIAETIFKINAILYPNSSNVYDSYAETLALNNKLKEAILNQEIVVLLGRINNNSNLSFFISNLEKMKNKFSKKQEGNN